MKNLIFILLAVFALGCGDGNKNSAGSGTNGESEQNVPIAPDESGDGSIHSDSTMTGGNNSQNQYDSLK